MNRIKHQILFYNSNSLKQLNKIIKIEEDTELKIKVKTSKFYSRRLLYAGFIENFIYFYYVRILLIFL